MCVGVNMRVCTRARVCEHVRVYMCSLAHKPICWLVTDHIGSLLVFFARTVLAVTEIHTHTHTDSPA